MNSVARMTFEADVEVSPTEVEEFKQFVRDHPEVANGGVFRVGNVVWTSKAMEIETPLEDES